MKKSHRSLCAAALCLSFSSFLAAQSFSDEPQPKVSSAIHPWAQQEVIEDVSPDVLARLAAARRQREQAAREPDTIKAEPVSLTNHAANISTSSPAVFSVATANIAPATALPESKLASVAPLPRQNAYYVLSANQRSPRFPYSTGDKFRLFVKDTVDPFALMGEAATALYNQAKGDPRAYGGGARGYSRRFGAIVGTDFAGEFFGTFLFSSLLHTDPRYFRMQQGSFTQRGEYALTRILVVRKDSGGYTFNAARWLSSLAATAISNTYYPDRRRGFGPTVQKAAINVGVDAFSDLFREFWPDIAHALRIPAFVIRRTADPLIPAKLQKQPAQPATPGE